MVQSHAYAQLVDEVVEFLASTPTPQQVIAFTPSDALQNRASYLLEVNRAGTLTSEERAELDEFGRLNHFMSMLKARARAKLGIP